MLAIEVELLTGRYVATAYNDRSAAEWPPHPARLFSALVATHFAEETFAEEERGVLEWLEQQGPPAVHASDATLRDVTTVFVPVNDVGMTNVDAEAEAVDEARVALVDAREAGEKKAIKKAETALAKAEKRLAAAIARSTAVPKGTASAKAGAIVLPEGRVRQPRTFPSVTPVEPRVTYVWPSADLTDSRRAAIDQLLARLVRLGHSSSLVAARLVEYVGEPRWRPSEDGGRILRTVQTGQLEALDRAYEQHRETEPRVMPARFTGYTDQPAAAHADVTESCFGSDWIVLRRVGGPSLPITAAAGVARTLRKALMLHASEPVPEVLTGHSSGGAPSTHDHLAVVPLPFVGHSKASGALLGVALVLPRGASSDERLAVYRAVDQWEQIHRQEDEDTPRLPLTLGAAGVLELERVEWGSTQSSLRPATWSAPATTWLSVTPVALDRNPGDLRSREADKLQRALGEARETIARACQRIGLPAPASIEILPAAPLAGAAKARQYPPFPELQGRTRRVLTHVRLEFTHPVRGPILLGAGRYLGLGLFRPGRADD